MKTHFVSSDSGAWRTWFQALAVLAGLLLVFGAVTLLLVFSAGQPILTAPYAFWSIGVGVILLTLAQVTRRVLAHH